MLGERLVYIMMGKVISLTLTVLPFSLGNNSDLSSGRFSKLQVAAKLELICHRLINCALSILRLV